MITLLKEFWSLMGRYRKIYILAGGALILATSFQLVFPWLLRQAIDAVTESSDWANQMVFFCSVLFFVAVGQAAFTYLKGRWSAAAAEGTVRDLRNKVYRHLMAMSFSAHSELHTGDVLQRSTSDIQTLSRFLGSQVTEVARTLCLLIGVCGFMIMMHPGLTAIAIAMLPPIFLFSLLFFGKIQRRFKKFDEKEAVLSERIQEHLTGIRVVKAFARESHEQSRFRKINREFKDQDIKLVGLHAFFWPVSDVLCMLQVVIILLAGGMKAVSGEISLGTFVAFNSYVMYLVWPVRHVGRLLGEMGRASISIRRLNEILDLPIETDEATTQWNSIRGGVSFRNVGFSYNSHPILKNICFEIQPGQSVAILGTTGSGKTTMMQLLTRFFDNYSGIIAVDGTDIREIPRPALRTKIGIVLQEAFLFSRSLYENIAFSVNNPTDKHVRETAKLASVDQFVQELPDKFETMVGERGVTLSGGQKQRVALARVLLKKPSIIILDDTTSALDTETESEICEALKTKLSGTTSFIITHRLSTAAGADVILVLNKGQLVQQGTHEELMNQPGYYQRLHKHQRARQAHLKEELHNELKKASREGISQTV